VARPPGSDTRNAPANPHRARSVCWHRAGALWACAALGGLLPASSAVVAQEANAASASTALYVRTDTDETVVVTPRLRVGAPLGEATRFDLVYTVDVWTSASIDIRTSASIVPGEPSGIGRARPVTEQRDEIDASLQHAFTDVTVSGSYRYSTEYDYESHGGALAAAYDFADNNAQVALGLRAYFDEVGRAGDPNFSRPSRMLTARGSFTQVLDTQTFLQLVYELTRQEGYLSSPYRFVRIADDVGAIPSTCQYPTTMYVERTLRQCLPENNPDERLRHAIALHVRRALTEALSAGANYRFYLDDWDMTSHTAGVDGALILDPGWLIALGYRFYHQSSASHFESYYPNMPVPEQYASDKELSALSSHRIELELSRSFELDEPGSELRAVLRAAPSFFIYDEFMLLDQVSALEVTFALEVTL
jgi:hypothetical protein